MSAARIDVKERLRDRIDKRTQANPMPPGQLDPMVLDLRMALKQIETLEHRVAYTIANTVTRRDHYRIAAMQSLMLRYDNLDPGAELARQVDELVDAMLGVESDL
jgi:hypothetical protein